MKYLALHNYNAQNTVNIGLGPNDHFLHFCAGGRCGRAGNESGKIINVLESQWRFYDHYRQPIRDCHVPNTLEKDNSMRKSIFNIGP